MAVIVPVAGSLAAEFPDYPSDALPECPAGFIPTHWHNDTCPTFRTPDDAVMIACDYPDPTMREFPDPAIHRFSVHVGDDVLFSSDNWEHIIAAAASAATR